MAEDVREAWYREQGQIGRLLLPRTIRAVFYEVLEGDTLVSVSAEPGLHDVDQAVTLQTGDDECFQILWIWSQGRCYDLALSGPQSLAEARFGSRREDGSFDASPRLDASAVDGWPQFMRDGLQRVTLFATQGADGEVLDAIELKGAGGTEVVLCARSMECPQFRGMDNVTVIFGTDQAARWAVGRSDPMARCVGGMGPRD